ncbi:MAG: hypothetical protein IJ604_01980 [Prevotella sp.]|nr:hypothetical protein [Prevotella sp.]MBR1462135.1 hypothetical protein [Prevotella sp.]
MERKRRFVARVLLSVFLLMTTSLSLHIHSAASNSGNDCYECAPRSLTFG